MLFRYRIVFTCFLSIILIVGCKREESDTFIIASLDPGIPEVLLLPCPLLVSRHTVDGNKEVKTTVLTLYTDSFGKINQRFNLTKPRRKEFYEIEPLETMWQLPVGDASMPLTAGIENNITFTVKPKWRYYVYLVDSSGKYEPIHFGCLHTMSKNYVGINKTFDSFPQFGTQSITVSAPSYSFINVYVSLRDRGSSKIIERKWTFNSMPVRSLWIKF